MTGKLLVDSQPAAGALLYFHREGATMQSIPSTATAEADGSFTVATGDKTGMPAGKYIVTVVWPEAKKLTQGQIMMGANPSDGPDRLKGAYETPAKSTIRIEIKAGPNVLEPINLKAG